MLGVLLVLVTVSRVMRKYKLKVIEFRGESIEVFIIFLDEKICHLSEEFGICKCRNPSHLCLVFSDSFENDFKCKNRFNDMFHDNMIFLYFVKYMFIEIIIIPVTHRKYPLATFAEVE